MFSVTRTHSLYTVTGYSTPARRVREVEFSGPVGSCWSLATSKQNQRCQLLINQSQRSLLSHLLISNTNTRNVAVYSGDGEERRPLITIEFSPGSWKSWITGFIMSLVLLPFGGSRLYWASFKARVDVIEEKIESVVETVEEVAEGVEKVAEVIDEHLPDGGEIDKAVKLVKNIAEEIQKGAELAEEALDKVEELETEVDKFINGANKTAKFLKERRD
ncbi:hypothetical protein Tsubulata_001586 [Turnera subulata]|uniref:Uncharacterized protein n=1 Tax=Turnera subulata TaxID=218843 RepID=A0A9Q0F0W3_9ROSI|nr:hypothetical protein Tsubulata_001586 [Turnera subulata]